MSAVRGPMPPMNGTGMRSPKSARLGIVCTALAVPRTRRCQPGRRVRRMPSGTPMAVARPTEMTTSRTCHPVSARISVAMRSALSRLQERPHGGVLIGGQLVRRAGGEEAAVGEQRETVGDARRLAHVVGDEDRRLGELALEGAEGVLELAPRDGIERGEGLVEEQ